MSIGHVAMTSFRRTSAGAMNAFQKVQTLHWTVTVQCVRTYAKYTSSLACETSVESLNCVRWTLQRKAKLLIPFCVTVVPVEGKSPLLMNCIFFASYWDWCG